jgi:hypothetical protein
MRTAALLAGLLLAVSPAAAEPVKYTWRGYGENVPGSSKCPGYRLTIEAFVEGARIWGQWQQEGRVVRPFDFAIGPDGRFGGKVDLQASIMTVSGQVGPDQARFDMKGYCKFGGALTKE